MGDLNFWQFLVEFFLLDFVSWRSTRPEVLCKSCSEKCCKTRRKTLALESFLNIPLQALEMLCHHRCFPVIFDDNEFFLWNGWLTKGSNPYFLLRLFSKVQHAATRFQTCARSEFRTWRRKQYSIDNHYTDKQLFLKYIFYKTPVGGPFIQNVTTELGDTS